ncbi:hypothetical protein DL764_008540 [Monosporascus ibericus]|uniref:NACHT domain-containing protein n=1 Tax=Monosporascus ibericus TaxID=155417 RepID=A0A4Q4T007_9PEZI|nr:hypothetical protein DL764_008540 [Monosporascus ibericus]
MAKRRQPCREDYTIGWVCALSLELAAAQEMLDEEHEDLDYDANDTNIYTLGRIGEHNVVIACLPEGQTGTNSAAAVAVQMQSAFTSIRFGLMVGIGGGVPSVEADIRLGDVVVSRPHKAHGGVVQYDSGKATPSGFARTGFLNTPPTILLNAVAKLRANHVRGKSRVTEYASKLNSLQTFAREDAGPDILFEADYNHVDGAACEQCSKGRVVERQSRGNQEIVVHYGIIASGNQVMRDAAERDRVSSELGGVLCFEMEAAGLMNCFPCLVIRALEDKLNRLPYAEDAPFNSYSKQHESDCPPDTRVDLLYDIYNWADGQDERCIFWLNGLAGTGKSTIARTVARKYSEERLGASFFFARGGGDVSRAGMFVTSIAVQLANNVPPLKRSICDAITDRSDITSQSLRDQWHHLVLRPLSKQDGNGCHSSYVLIVDALDECDDDNSIRIILQLLAEARTLKTVGLRVFLTSRPEISIRYGFCQIPDVEHQDFILHHISPSVVDHDIYIFLDYNLGLIRQERRLDAGWPGKEVVTRLAQNASGLFIWAATACRFIHEGKRFAVKRLDMTICGNRNAATGPEKRLDEIYITVLQNSIPSDYTDEEIKEQYRTLGHALGSVAVLFSPLSIRSLIKLWDTATRALQQTFKGHRGAVNIAAFSPDGKRVLSCDDGIWGDYCTVKLWDAATGALQQTFEGHQGLVKTVQFSPDGKMVASCRDGAFDKDDDGRVKHWDAATGALQQTLRGGRGPVTKITFSPDSKMVASSHSGPGFHDTLKFWDAATGVLQQIFEDSPCWFDKIIFSPDGKMVGPYNYDKIKFWDAATGTLRQTFDHQGPIEALTFSPDGKMVASCEYSAVKIWDASTGALQQTFKCYQDRVTAITFSPDSKMVASYSRFDGNGDSIVKLWDTATEALQQTLEHHQGLVTAITFSPDGRMVASCDNGAPDDDDDDDDDGTVKLWDAATGALQQTFKGYWGPVTAIAFSPDGNIVASCNMGNWESNNGIIKLWNTTTGAIQQTFKVHKGWINTVTFSLDGKMVASCDSGSSANCGNGTVMLWDAATGALQQTLKGDAIIQTFFLSDTFLQTTVNEQWVRWGTEDMLWLPFEHRPSCTAVYGNVVALGYRSGRLSILEFAF